MKKVYLLVYGRELGTRPQIKACLNSLTEVISWRSEMPNSFFILSESDAKTIGEAIRLCTGTPTTRFLILEIPPIEGNRWGWLVKDSWKFIDGKKNKEP